MSTSAIDFSKYTTQPEAGGAPIDFGKYATPHENAGPETAMPREMPTPPTYLGEAAAGAGRFLKSTLYDLPKAAIETMGTPTGLIGKTASDVWHGMERATTAADVAAAQGEGRAGQTYEYLSNLPFVGSMVQKAGEAGPGYAKFAPQTLGAVTEGSLYAAGPELAKRAPGALNKVVPSLTRAGENIGALRQTLDPAPVTGRLPSYIKASDLVDKWDRTAASVPPELRAYVERVKEASTGGNLTFQSLWEAREALNDLKYDKNLTPKRAAMIGDIAKHLSDEVQGIANREGVGKQWRAAQSEYARGKSIERFGQNIGEPLGAAAGLKYGSALGEPFAAAYVGGQLGRMVAKPVIGGMVSSVLRRDVGPSTLSSIPVPPEPPPIPSATYPQTRENYLRQMLRAKEGDISSTRLNQLIKGSPPIRKMPQEPPSPPTSAADLYENARQPGDMAWNALPGPARETLQNELDRNGVQSAQALAERLAKVHRGWRRPGRIPQLPEEEQ